MPSANYAVRMIERHERVLAQSLMAQPAVEALDMGVLIGPAKLDALRINPLVVCPHSYFLAPELRAVVRADYLQLAS